MEEVIYLNARVVDPARGIDEIQDVAVRDGLFANPEELRSPTIVALQGKVLCPGFIDVHVHLRYPGQTHKEDIASATAAAANGGFTSVLAMPNTTPAADSAEIIRDVVKRSQGMRAHVMQACCITKGRLGKELADMEHIDAPAFTDDGSTTQDEALMRRAMSIAARRGIPIIDHCENTSLSKPGVMHEGAVSKELGLPGQPRAAEESIVERDIRLAEETGCRVHLQHLSSAGSVAMLRAAVGRGLPVSGEATPHHLFLTDEACRKFGVNAKMAPPLREESDRLALVEALRDGTITIVATDHAPHTAEEKAVGWLKAPFGIVGIEAAVPLCLTELYHAGILTLMQTVSLFTAGPRRLLNLPLGSMQPGEPADITILDIEKPNVIDVAKFLSRGRNCPYDGWKCFGKAVGTLLGIRN